MPQQDQRSTVVEEQGQTLSERHAVLTREEGCKWDAKAHLNCLNETVSGPNGLWPNQVGDTGPQGSSCHRVCHALGTGNVMSFHKIITSRVNAGVKEVGEEGNNNILRPGSQSGRPGSDR